MPLLRLSAVMVMALLFMCESALSAELVMFRRDGCPWCTVWEREIEPIYGKTAVGQRVPLRKRDIADMSRDLSLRGPIRYTPTFVVVEGGRELARIEGYAGDDFFWAQLENLIRDLPGQSDLSMPTFFSPCCEPAS
jgi:thioredoxin-related protein